MENSKYGKYIVSTLQEPGRNTPDIRAAYAMWAKRVLWMDNDVVPGAFQMNCTWYLRPPVKSTESLPHVHDSDEIIGFFSDNPDKPYDLGAEIEFWLEDEMHLITSSSMIFIPHGMTHCPLILRRVDTPIFHFSVLTGEYYTRI